MTDEQLRQLLEPTIRRLCEDAYAGHPQPDWAKAVEADIVAEAAWRIEQQGRFRLRAWAWLNRCHVLDWGDGSDGDFVVPRYGYYDPNFSLPTNAGPRFASSLALASAAAPPQDLCQPPEADRAGLGPSRE